MRRGREAVEFYTAAFGAVEIFRVGGTEENEDIVAQLSVGNASFWVSDESPRNKNFSPESLGGTTVRLLSNRWEIGKPLVEWPPSQASRASREGA